MSFKFPKQMLVTVPNQRAMNKTVC